MTQPRPTATELLEAVREFLTGDVVPVLDGRLRFHAKVAANVLAAVERELRDGAAADRGEQERLVLLLTEAGAPTTDDRGETLDVDALARVLASLLRAGVVAADDPRLVDHLQRTTRADVAIANPTWLPDRSVP